MNDVYYHESSNTLLILDGKAVKVKTSSVEEVESMARTMILVEILLKKQSDDERDLLRRNGFIKLGEL